VAPSPESRQDEAVTDQFSLFDAPPITDRLFFAIFPDPATAAGSPGRPTRCAPLIS
jgi:hypothetical protein